MFEKEANEQANKKYSIPHICNELDLARNYKYKGGFKDGAEFGYNKGKEDVKHDLMMKLKDEGIVKPLKDNIFSNKKVNSQEQQELCAWIECAMDFGENLDECAKKLEEANKANEWHDLRKNPNDLPKEDLRQRTHGYYLTASKHKSYKGFVFEVAYFTGVIFTRGGNILDNIIAWKEIVIPKENEIKDE